VRRWAAEAFERVLAEANDVMNFIARVGGNLRRFHVTSDTDLSTILLARTSGWDGFKNRPNSTRAFLLKLRNMGFYAWLFSFIAFIGYLNFMSVVCLYVALAAIVVLVLYYRYLDTDAE
jgi:hypothetical protein